MGGLVTIFYQIFSTLREIVGLFFLSPPHLRIFTCKFVDHFIGLLWKFTYRLVRPRQTYFVFILNLVKPLVILKKWNSCEVEGGKGKRANFSFLFWIQITNKVVFNVIPQLTATSFSWGCYKWLKNYPEFKTSSHSSRVVGTFMDHAIILFCWSCQREWREWTSHDV